MLALQGPAAEALLTALLAEPGNAGPLPPPDWNAFSRARFRGAEFLVGRTGYTGEHGFELFVPSAMAVAFAEELLRAGAPLGAGLVGLAARDAARTEAGLPLGGHEIGEGPDGRPIPILALRQYKLAVDFCKPEFVGREALLRQLEELKELHRSGRIGRPLEERALPRRVWPVAVHADPAVDPRRNIPRQGFRVELGGRAMGAFPKNGRRIS
jgi:aminomethyltransferase